jgi:anti-sigma regulatory factor (Ser/Thr protein kinase)
MPALTPNCVDRLGTDDQIEGRCNIPSLSAVRPTLRHLSSITNPLVEFTLCIEHVPAPLTAHFIDAGIVVTPPETPVMPSIAVSYDELGGRGRGLALVQMTTDHFQYQRTPSGENVWLIMKRFPE